MNKLTIAFLVVLSVQYATSSTCPTDVKVQPNFKFHKVLGNWYEYARNFNNFENGISCVQADYIENSNGTVTVRNSGITSSGAPIVSFEHFNKISPGFFTYDEGGEPFYMLATDYKNYLVTYSCADGVNNFWILTKNKALQPSLQSAAYSALKNNNLPVTQLVHTAQNC